MNVSSMSIWGSAQDFIIDTNAAEKAIQERHLCFAV